VHETLDTALATITNVLLEQDRFLKIHPARENQVEAVLRQNGQQLRFFDQMLRGLKARSQSNIKRLKNEINLVSGIVDIGTERGLTNAPRSSILWHSMTAVSQFK
jgi:hypothetical protein